MEWIDSVIQSSSKLMRMGTFERIEKNYLPINGVKFEDLIQNCKILNKVFQARKLLKMEHGTLKLELKRIWFKLDENRKPLNCEMEKVKLEVINRFKESESGNMFEEFKVLTNQVVSKFLLKFVQKKSVLTIHKGMREKAKADFITFLE
jgi:hypothetical protein